MRAPEEIFLTEKILRDDPLCNNCLGRQFPKFRPELSNEERGLLLRFFARTKIRGWSSEGYTWKELHDLFGKQSCNLCHGIFEKIDDTVNKLIERTKDYEFGNFLCGARIPFEISEREDILRSKYKLKGESLRKEIIRLVGLRMNELLNKKTSFSDPDIKITFEPFKVDLNIKIISKPIFFLVEYVQHTKCEDSKKEIKQFLLKEFDAEAVKIKEVRSSGLITYGNPSLHVKIVHPKKRKNPNEQAKVLNQINIVKIEEVKKKYYRKN